MPILIKNESFNNIFLWKFVLLEINSVLWESFRWKLLYKCLLIL